MVEGSYFVGATAGGRVEERAATQRGHVWESPDGERQALRLRPAA